MNFRVTKGVGQFGDYTIHRSDGDDENEHLLQVANSHRKNKTGTERSVTMKNGDRFTTLIVRSQKNETVVSATGGKPTSVPMASEQLQSLIEHHSKSPEWMPLLDKLAEEYPEHFDSAVAAHTAARQGDAAAQYARAFAESQRQ